MQLLTATVTKPARSVTTKYGDRTVADVRLPDGTEAALWRPANDPALTNLHAGQSVTVAKDSKGKINLIDNATAPSPQPLTSEGMTTDTKRAIAAYVGEMGDLYAFCYSTAQTKLPNVEPETTRAMASSLFIAAQRKFGLA